VRLLVVVVVIWLVIGAVAVFQRGYLGGSNNCGHISTVAVTVVAGPLNYVGVNPKVSCDVTVPQPSK
jgi:hypothetical protein